MSFQVPSAMPNPLSDVIPTEGRNLHSLRRQSNFRPLPAPARESSHSIHPASSFPTGTISYWGRTALAAVDAWSGALRETESYGWVDGRAAGIGDSSLRSE